jgi:O-antigen ligase
MPFSSLDGILHISAEVVRVQVITSPPPAPGIRLARQLHGLHWSALLGVCLLLNCFVRGGHTTQRILQIALLLGFGASILFSRTALLGLSYISRPARWLLAAFFALGSISAALAYAPHYAFYEVSTLLLLGVLALAVAAEVARDANANLERVLRVMGYVCLLYSFKVVVVYLSAFSLGAQPDAGDFTPGFSNYRFFNHAQTVSLPLLALLYVLTPKDSKLRRMWFAATVMWWTLLFVTSARGSTVGLLGGCLLVAALQRRHALPFLKAMGLSAIAGLAAYYLFFHLIPLAAGFLPFGEMAKLVGRTAADPASGRSILWQRAAELIAADPLLGAGPLHFAHVAFVTRQAAHPHNWVLQIASEWGIPALLCLSGAIGLGLRGLVRVAPQLAQGDSRNQHILAGLVATGAAILADGLLSGLIVMPQSQLMIALYLGLALGWRVQFRKTGTGNEAARPALLHRSLAALVILGALAGIAGGVWPEIMQRAAGAELPPELARINGNVHWPRLWLSGFF